MKKGNGKGETHKDNSKANEVRTSNIIAAKGNFKFFKWFFFYIFLIKINIIYMYV